MRRINHFSHISFTHAKLMNFLPKGSFSSRLRKSIGNEINWILDSDDENDRLGTGGAFLEMGNYSVFFPVQSLFMWIIKSGGITPEHLENEDGSFLDDNNELIPAIPKPLLTGVEQMAAFGLWFIDCEMDICGPSSEEDYDVNRINPQGWMESQVLHHKAECLLNAYQALSYAERLSRGEKLTEEESEKMTHFDFSATGKEGAKKRHAQMNALRIWAVDLYRSSDWPSANKAAHDLQDQIMDYGRTINAILRPSNAQRTIAEWFRKSV